MLLSAIFGLLATIMFTATPALAVDNSYNSALTTKLRNTVTHVDFWNTLSNDDMVFDFATLSYDPYNPGSVLNANVASWPILLASKMTIAQINLGACAMLAPHIHPHATNIVVVTAGEVQTYMRAENGAVDRQTTLTPGKMTYFPHASLHSMVNTGTSSLPFPSLTYT